MKRITLGILAHVDAGKTTLSESLLYEAGVIKEPGRVDNKSAFLDTDIQERERGITIFSKQAVFTYQNEHYITLIDTPGHVDFSAEMERALWIMDYAVLVINGADGIQGHTKTLWKLLNRYEIPTFLFINKMDREGTDKEILMNELRKEFGENCVDFSDVNGNAPYTLSHIEENALHMVPNVEAFYEVVAVCDEELLEAYLDLQAENENNGSSFLNAIHKLISQRQILTMIKNRKVFPCFFGSALKQTGVDYFLETICGLMDECRDIALSDRQNVFGGKVYKINRDDKGNRLTYIKVTSGSLCVKDTIGGEKVNQIRIYSGEKYEAVSEAPAGMVCAVTGLTSTYNGQGLGIEKDAKLPVLEPVLTYTVKLPEDMDSVKMLPLLKTLEEEEPALHILWQEETQTIQVKLMGTVQIEVLTRQIKERFGVAVSFGMGSIVYKETIEDTVEGVGHYEPLRHYAEVHLILEPGERGSGMQFASRLSEDVLDKNWQRLILTHLEEKEHVGVLTGSLITDMKITLVSGKAHTKHTEGGDFRQATYRAVRQGLMQARSKLLEPYYSFRLEIPSDCLGRAMTDMENMYGKCDAPLIEGENAVLTGIVPVSTLQDYQIEVSAYTKGRGSIFCSLSGFYDCHNAEEVMETMHYDAETDMKNPTGSVFCAHGAGFLVAWDEVKNYMHLDSVLLPARPDFDEEVETEIARRKSALFDGVIDEEQITEIINRSSHNNERPSKHYQKKKAVVSEVLYKGAQKPKNRERYLIVDGYNIVHAWDELNCLIEDNLDGARAKLLDILCNYQGYVKCELIVVFDAYKVKGNLGEMYDYENIHVVYTKEAETADSYIEKLTHRISKDYSVTVATSDGLIQLITRGQNCVVMSARELKEAVEIVNEEIRTYLLDEEDE